jgi:hypothetical protein
VSSTPSDFGQPAHEIANTAKDTRRDVVCGAWIPRFGVKPSQNQQAPKHFAESQLSPQCGVRTKRFNQQVRRNRKRFPADFMFQLTAKETGSLRSQIATLKTSGGQHREYSPHVAATGRVRNLEVCT